MTSTNGPARVYVVGTCDTKAEELNYACRLIREAGASAVLVDVGTKSDYDKADVPAREVAGYHPDGPEAVFSANERGAAVSAMAIGLGRFLQERDDIGCVLGLGGSGNTALVTAAMQELPIGVPKLMVSTVASGNVAPYVGPNDIGMVYSVTDVAGINAISRKVIGNAAHAAAGMALWQVPQSATDRPGIGISMFGVTTQCVTQLREKLEPDYDSYVFHATGTGGQSLEKLVDSDLLQAVIDTTTTEVADHLFGGVFPCTDDRFGAIARSKIPYVGSVGAVDMINFGARDTVPEQHRDRNFYIHNAQVTLMRTTAEENRAIGAFIAERLNRCDGEVRFLLPLNGVSALAGPDQPFHDPEADAALFDAIRSTFNQTARRRLIELPYAINDAAFVDALYQNFQEIAR